MTRSLPILLAFLFRGCGIEPDNPLIGAARSGDTQSLRSLLAGGVCPNPSGVKRLFHSLVRAILEPRYAQRKAW